MESTPCDEVVKHLNDSVVSAERTHLRYDGSSIRLPIPNRSTGTLTSIYSPRKAILPASRLSIIFFEIDPPVRKNRWTSGFLDPDSGSAEVQLTRSRARGPETPIRLATTLVACTCARLSQPRAIVGLSVRSVVSTHSVSVRWVPLDSVVWRDINEKGIWG